jgi:hypothetical protein
MNVNLEAAVRELLAEWAEYVRKMNAGIPTLASEESRQFAALQVQMTERHAEQLEAAVARSS